MQIRWMLFFMLGLCSCDNSNESGRDVQKQSRGEHIFRCHGEHVFPKNKLKKNKPPKYPWERRLNETLFPITKAHFRCRSD